MSLLQNFDMQQRARPLVSGRLHGALDACIGLIRNLAAYARFPSLRAEIDDYRRLEQICRQLAGQSAMPQQRAAMLIMAQRYQEAADALA